MSKRVRNCGKRRVRRPAGFVRPETATTKPILKFIAALHAAINEGQENARRDQRRRAIKRAKRLERNPSATYLRA